MFIPTRSGDGTFILEFAPSQYTLFVLFFGARSARHSRHFQTQG
jgi:hypothetical protein